MPTWPSGTSRSSPRRRWRFSTRSGPTGSAIEVNQFQELLADRDRSRLATERDLLMPLLWKSDNHVNKDGPHPPADPAVSRRVGSIQGRIPGARLLVEQLRDFPNGDHDDGPDALEMAIRAAGSPRPEPVEEIIGYIST